MFYSMKMLAVSAVVLGALALAQPAMADHAGLTIGVGSGVRHAAPAQVAFTSGSPFNPGFAASGFVQPSIIAQPNFTPLNYYLPGDFYARSTYYVPSYVSPVVLYPAPVTISNNFFNPSGFGPGHRPFNGR